MARACIIIPILILLISRSLCQQSSDQLTQANPLSPGDVLISKDGAFALGFFSAGNYNKSLYVGIWYNKVPEHTVVWVANRDSPVIAPSRAKLAITGKPELGLSDSQGRIRWTTTNSAAAGGADAFAVLLNSGNFVLQTPTGETIWQSFDYPTDTLLPTMRLLLNHKGQVPTRIISWKSPDDPSTGNFSYGIDPNWNLQFFTWYGTLPYSRSNALNDASMSSGMYLSNGASIVYQAIVDTGNRLYYIYTVSEGSPYTRIWLDYTGKMRTQSWNSNTSSWMLVFERPHSSCDLYAQCGPFGYCDSTGDVPTCRCPEGFEPIDGVNYSRGCRRKEALRCGKEDSFVTLPAMKVPDKFLYLRNRSFDQCAAECSRNCSCVAYAYDTLSLGDSNGDTSRCLVWTGDLIDMEKASFHGNLYLRIAGSPVKKKKKSHLTKILLPIIAFVLPLTFTALVWTCKRRGRRQKKKVQKRVMLEYLRSPDEMGDKNIEFPFISFEDIAAATDHFSDSNMLGKGGFGKVYKGVLGGTKEVAVKRLSKGSVQGMEEFKNEAVLIAKLQHKNLVKLIGCCIYEDERLLVYEYLPNKSLDYFLFDSSKKSVLQWTTRFKIIQGVARGIMYLHQDSRLTIIHRDLKTSNILLDKEMSPKISDFGMARIFFGKQLQANTNRVVGTYGYMAPEYAMEGSFSVKSDTYSFGVILLEIVSGLKISSPHLLMDFPNLIAYAWNLWKDGKSEQMVDSFVVESNCPLDEVSRCVQIGLLCVQDDPGSRPVMAVVVFMLENRTTPLPTPKQPSYFAQRGYKPRKAGDHREVSTDMSLTALEAR